MRSGKRKAQKRTRYQTHRARQKAAKKKLRQRQKRRGMRVAPRPTLPNRLNEYESTAEEGEDRQKTVMAQLSVIRSQLPGLLARFSRIKDPRNPKKLKHKLAVMLLSGMLLFVFHMSSRREANREMSRPMFLSNLKELIPELESLAHQDTLNRLLSVIEVEQIEQSHVELLRRLMRHKKFNRYVIEQCYPLAIDGSQKLASYEAKSEQWQERKVGNKENPRKQYYVYVLQASLAFRNGMVVPLMTEFLTLPDGDVEIDKQDSELKAFYRLTSRLKEAFPRTHFLLLLDGLYANGPVMELCRRYNWQFMIVLKDNSLPTVWDEFNGLQKLDSDQNFLPHIWGQREQLFRWSNRLLYEYGPNGNKHIRLHMVVCQEQWEEIDPKTTKSIIKRARHVWLSSQVLHKGNLHALCNLGARHRWGIEAGFLVEKHQGYQFEHCFSYDWNAMKGYHYLMRLGEMFNVLVFHTTALVQKVKTIGKRGLIAFVRQSLSGPWLDHEAVRVCLASAKQIRLI